MRPTPRPKHRLAVCIFAAYAVMCVYFAAMDDDLSVDQTHIATAALKRHQGELFRHDMVFGTDDLWRFPSPALQGVIELVLVPTGYKDLFLPFRAICGVAVMFYLCGMYALLYRQTRSWSVSAFVAVLSSTVTYTLGHAFWGVGPLSSMTPQGVCVAAVPLIVLGLLKYSDVPRRVGDSCRLMLVFTCIGLLGNLHPPTAVNLTIVLASACLVRMRFRLRAWLLVSGGCLAAAICAAPYLGYCLMLREQISPDSASSAQAVEQAIRAGGLAALYPDLLKSLLNWLIYAAALIIPATAVLIRTERFRVRDLRFWVAMIVAGLAVALGLSGFAQAFGSIWGLWLVTFPQAAVLVMLPLYVLFAQALTSLFRIVVTNRRLLPWSCAAVMIAWMAPSDNFRYLRHAIYESATSFMSETHKPLRVQELHARRQGNDELNRIADWASSTPNEAAFMIDDVEFRVRARRSILASRDDVGYFLYIDPARLESWIGIVEKQDELLHRAIDVAGLVQFRDAAAASGTAGGASEWYAIAPAAMGNDSASAYEIKRPGWGRFYRVYLLPSHMPAQSAPIATSQNETFKASSELGR